MGKYTRIRMIFKMKRILLKAIGFIEKREKSLLQCANCPQTFHEVTKHVDHVMVTGHTQFSEESRSSYYYSFHPKHFLLSIGLSFLWAFVLLFLLVLSLNLLTFMIPKERIHKYFQVVALFVILSGSIGGPMTGSWLYNRYSYPDIRNIKVHPITKGQRLVIMFCPFELLAIPLMILTLNTSGVVHIFFLIASLFFLAIGVLGFYSGVVYLVSLIGKKFYNLIRNI